MASDPLGNFTETGWPSESQMESEDSAPSTPRHRAPRTPPLRVPKRNVVGVDADLLLQEPNMAETRGLYSQVQLPPLPHYGPKDQPYPFLVDAGRQPGPELEPWNLLQQPAWQNPWANASAGTRERLNYSGCEAMRFSAGAMEASWARDEESEPFLQDIDAFLKFVERGCVGDIEDDKKQAGGLAAPRSF